MTPRIRNVQVDVGPDAFDAAVAWWAAALGGVARETDGTYVHLDGVRSRVGVHLQRLGGGAGGYHLDLEVDDVAAEVARLVAAGAEDLGPIPGEPGERVLRDPAGLVFCLTSPGQAQHLSDDRSEGVHLRVLLLDVPRDAAGAEVAFWAAALDLDPRREPNYPDYTAFVPTPGWRSPTNLYVQAVGDPTPRMHLDLHCPDAAAREVQVARLVELGAEEVGRFERWVQLRAPGGQLVCVVPDAVSE